MHEWVAELWATERMERMRDFAARQALRQTLRPPRRPLRLALGMALIRIGRWLLPRTPEPGPSRAGRPEGVRPIADVASPLGKDSALAHLTCCASKGRGRDFP